MTRRTAPILWFPMLVLATACGGSGSGSGGGAAARLSLIGCTLGCAGGNCSVGQIEENATLVFNFNQAIQESSVGPDSISITLAATGAPAVGQFQVAGKEVRFVPTFVDGPAGPTFGFDHAGLYRVEIGTGSATQKLRSSSGALEGQLSCLVRTEGIQDYVPGPPVVAVSPSGGKPADGAFDIVLVFADVLSQVQVLDGAGGSPTVAVELVTATGPGLPVSGTFFFLADVDAGQSVLTFHPDQDFPYDANGTRHLEVTVDAAITDLAGNALSNPGGFRVELPAGGLQDGELLEDFTGIVQLDAERSAAGLWTGSGFLDSGLAADTGRHRGGGHGLLGDGSLDGLTLSTEATTFSSPLLGLDLDLDGANQGAYFFTKLELGTTASASGSAPLRLITRGAVSVTGTLNLSGAAGDLNFPLYRPVDERVWFLPGEEPSAEMQSLLSDLQEATGGLGGSGELSAGSGGQGGASWYTLAFYYDDDLDGWYEWEKPPGGNPPDPARYFNGATGPATTTVHGSNGGRVGGGFASGTPFGATNADHALDLDQGSGMGTFAWPPKSNRLPLDSEVSANTWWSTTNGDDIGAYYYTGSAFFEWFSRARARGGGGGGYWLTGERGWVHDPDPAFMDPRGSPLVVPDLDDLPNQSNFDFNGVRSFLGSGDEQWRDWPSYLAWDGVSGGSMEDGAGGQLSEESGGLPVAFFTLDPESGFLRGGSGGGGAGMGQHGSYNREVFSGANTFEAIDSYRTSDGAGGGAGGGAVQFHCGGDFLLSGLVDLAGGDGGSSAAQIAGPYAIDPVAFFKTMPGDAGGGGGSGGALLLQVGGNLQAAAKSIDLNGGAGGVGAVGNHGGAGGAGVLRLESAAAFDLGDLDGIVLPLEAADLGQRPEFGLSGANWSDYGVAWPGGFGDFSVARAVGAGSVFFNGNASGVASGWYQVPTTVLEATLTGYLIRCEWSDGSSGAQILDFDQDQPPTPGLTPLWMALQTAVPGGNARPWLVPGFNTLVGGVEELATQATDRARWHLVFDQDLVAALIGNHPKAYFRVLEVHLLWEE